MDYWQFGYYLIIIFAVLVGIWITNSHIDRVEDRFKKLLKELLKENP